MKKRKLLKLTDNDGLITEGKTLYKIHHYGKAHTFHYEEIDPEEYDNRINTLADKIAKYPNVNLLDVVKDSLYDLPLKLLERLEQKLVVEETKAAEVEREPKVATKTTNRGTCVDLTIGGKYALNLRA